MAIISKKITNSIHLFTKITPLLFDVSLRDGIQNADPKLYNMKRKQEILNDILFEERPRKIELGSIVSPKILPIMRDSLELYHYSKNLKSTYDKFDAYMLVPNIPMLDVAIANNIPNISFITSVSDVFQHKNTRKTIAETKRDFDAMFASMQKLDYYKDMNRKLYISCIDQCPLTKRNDISYIAKEINEYHEKYDFTELSLSDTCGTLEPTRFDELMSLCLLQYGIPVSKISLHLHVSNSRKGAVKRIIKNAFDLGIFRFDVSFLETGGCSVTMKKDQIVNNITYSFFYECFHEYLVERYPTV